MLRNYVLVRILPALGTGGFIVASAKSGSLCGHIFPTYESAFAYAVDTGYVIIT